MLHNQIREPRTLPVALAAYVAHTKPGEHTRERVATNLYLAMPWNLRAATLAELGDRIK